jgi:predicted oxidoreductase
MTDADVIIIGAGLAGLVAAIEIANAGKRVIVLDQEPRHHLGGQAFWSLGGLFLINSPEQRRLGIRDHRDLALQDWLGTANFDRHEDYWPKCWAEAYLDFSLERKRSWLRKMGHRFFPLVGWAERGGGQAAGHGNSVPRFHITWGTGPGLLEPFICRALEAERRGLAVFRFRHRVDGLAKTGKAVTGVHGTVLEPSDAPRGTSTSRNVVGGFDLRAEAVIVASGGIGGNHEMVRDNWPIRLGPPPKRMICGVPAHVDGRMMIIAGAAGARLINLDRMWHYVEGIRNWKSIWPNHGVRILPGPSAMWFDARGNRLPAPLYPGYDTTATIAHLRNTGFDYSWFVLTQSIIHKEFALSGSEQNPDLTGRDWPLIARRLIGTAATAPLEAFKRNGQDFIVRDDLDSLVAGMNALTGEMLLDARVIRREIEARDRELANRFTKDSQLMAIYASRRYVGDRLFRTAKPHRLLDSKHGPLIAIRLHILTRKTLGGLETDLDGRVFGLDGDLVPGLYAVGEAAGFGGGGMHGHGSLEGTFLGGCLFSGLQAGRAAAKVL